MTREIEFQELNDEQLDQVTGGGSHWRGGGGHSFRFVEVNVNFTVQNATAIAIGRGATAVAGNFNNTSQR
jgi:bacteriocin-like protein